MRLWLTLAMLFVAAPNAAAASWSAPTTIGPPAGTIIDPAIAFGGGAGPLISAGFRPEVGYSPGKPLQTVTRLFDGRTERAQVRLVVPPVAFGAARAAFLRQSPRDRDFAPIMTLGVSLGDLAGNPGGFHRLSLLAIPDTAAIAANDAGVVAVAWTEATRGIDGRVKLAVRRPGGRFARAVDAAIGTDGAAIVVWSEITGEQTPLDVVAAVRPPGASDFASPEEVSPREGATTPVAAFDPRTGRPTVAWVATNEQGATLRIAERR